MCAATLTSLFFACGSNVTCTYVESTGTLTISGTGDMYSYSGKSDSPWHNYRSSIKKVVINNGVTSIGGSAFWGCDGLTSVTIPNSVTSIGSHAFSFCTGLTSITIPSSVTSIGEEAFAYCEGLTSINVAEDNLNYASIDGVLYSKDKKTLIDCPTGKTGSITIPSSVTSIGEEAFAYCEGLTSINVAEDNLNYASIDGVLYSKDKKTLIDCPTGKTGSVTIPNSVTSIGKDAFYMCTGLTSVTIPNSVTSIGSEAFRYCEGLTSVTIPNSVTSIEYLAFSDCTGLTSMTIPNSVTSIGGWAFGECTGLTSVTIPNSVTSIGGSAFWGCDGLTSVTIPNSVTSIGSHAFSFCTGLTSITIGNGVKSIEEEAFRGCTGLTSVTIPNSVTSIEEEAFRGCTGLTSMTVEATNPPSSDGYIVSNYNIPLYVPAGSIDAYKAADEWKNFTSIRAR